MKKCLRIAGVAASLAGAVFVARSYAETYTLNTFYPSPVGVYNNVTVTSTTALATKGGNVTIGNPSGFPGHRLAVNGSVGADFMGYGVTTNATSANKLLMDGESVPAPGRLFYNRDRDMFYYTSRDALPEDKSTWFKQMSGFDAALIVDGALTAPYNLPGSFSAVHPWTAYAGGVTSGATGLKTTPKLSKSGLYIISAEVNFCTKTGFNDKVVNLRIYKNSTQVVVLSDPVTLGPNSCQDFSLEGMVFLNAGQTVNFYLRGKRTVAQDKISAATLKVERVLSF